MEVSRRVHRRGRGIRGPLFPPEVPRWQSRSQRFDAAVLEAYAPLQQKWREQLTQLDIAVDTVPRMRLDFNTIWPDEVVALGPIPLARLVPAGVDRYGAPTRPRIVVFRMPIQQRAQDAEQLDQVLRYALGKLVATYLNIPAEDITLDWD